jgi:glycosyltransferase involved in cell wall biosynthesis
VDLDAVRTASGTRPSSAFATTFDSLSTPRIVSVGRLVPQKAFHDLIHAFAKVSKRNRGSLTIFGIGPLENDLRQVAREHGVEDRVYLPGFEDNPFWYMAQAECFALSSVAEGFGLVIVEAMACGTPVVVTDCPSGPSEIVQDRINGRLVPVGEPQALAAALDETLDLVGAGRDARLSAAGESIERFRPERILNDYLTLLKP